MKVTIERWTETQRCVFVKSGPYRVSVWKMAEWGQDELGPAEIDWPSGKGLVEDAGKFYEALGVAMVVAQLLDNFGPDKARSCVEQLYGFEA